MHIVDFGLSPEKLKKIRFFGRRNTMYQKNYFIWIAVLSLIASFIFAGGCQEQVKTAPEIKAKTQAAPPTQAEPAKVAKKEPAAPVGKTGPFGFKSSWAGDGFITNWLVIGPFPNPGERPENKGFNIDYLENYGGEAGHIPAKGMEIAAPDGKKLKWERYKSSAVRIDIPSIRVLDIDYDPDDILIYAACWVECDQDVEAELRIGSDDGYKLWLDHQLLGEQRVYRSAEQDQETYPVKLAKGRHLLLLKVDQDWGAYEFMLRVVTANGEEIPTMKVWLKP